MFDVFCTPARYDLFLWASSFTVQCVPIEHEIS